MQRIYRNNLFFISVSIQSFAKTIIFAIIIAFGGNAVIYG